MHRRLSLLLLALLLAGCAKPATLPTSKPGPDKTTVPVPTPNSKPTPAPTLSDLQAKLKKADDLLVGGQNRDAVALLIDLVGAQPDSPGAWDLLTLGLVRLGYPIAGRMAGERAVHLQPEGATIRFNTGLAYYRAHEWEKAILHLTEAVRLNQVSEEPRLFLARAQAGMDIQLSKAADLVALQAQYPSDPDIRLFLAQFQISRADLDGDGTPERFDREKATVSSGRDGTLYLALPPVEPKGMSWSVSYGLLGEAGDRFLLRDVQNGGATLYRFDGKALVKVDQKLGSAIFAYGRALKESIPDSAKRVSHITYYTWRDGALVAVSQVDESWDTGLPIPPITDGVDLFLTVSQEQLPERVFASKALHQETYKRVVGKLYQSFLLPAPDGSFHLELWAEGALVGRAKATLDKQWRIEKLDWE